MKLTRKEILVYGAGVFSGLTVLAVSGSFATDSAVPYSFEDGEVISADVMNDLFAQLQNVTVGFEKVEELNGVWTCSQYDVGDPPAAEFPARFFTLNTTTGVYEASNTWTFDTVSGTTTLTTTDYLVGSYNSGNNGGGVCPVNTGNTTYDYSVFLAEGYLLLGQKAMLSGCVTTPVALKIQKASPFKFKYDTTAGFGICIKRDQPPSIPSNLQLTSNGVRWADNSTNESSFVVTKRSASGGGWQELAELPANTTVFDDPTMASGDTYRVFARNQNGASLGSNVVRVP